MFDCVRENQGYGTSTGPIGSGTAQHFDTGHVSRLAGHTARKPSRSMFESVAIVLGMLLSTSALGAFVFYQFYLRGVSGFGIYVHYALLLSLYWCTIAYQISRFGSARRASALEPFPEDELAYLFDEEAPKVTVLVPSYREERRVLISTILSAALAQYSNRNIVVLVDDSPGDAAAQRSTFDAIAEVRGWLTEESGFLNREASSWLERRGTGAFATYAEARRLASNYRQAAGWLREIAAKLEAEQTKAFNHVDSFVIERIVMDLAGIYERRAEMFDTRDPSIAEVDAEYRRLATLFCSDITSFQRKAFENLSHAPNKAMNLNAYIGLMGGRYNFVDRGGRRFVEETSATTCDLSVVEPEFVLTLDADSVILGQYILTLVHTLNGNPRLGVAQTPYRTFPGGASPIERMAGATTDIQYLVHQGSTYFDAAYWVGANALIRFTALKDIERHQPEGDKQVKVYVQDRTVIEDTGSTIDLLQCGWKVHNHFMTLAYSATPADFGALSIQRKRWANGGLILFPSLLREYLRAGRWVRRIPELALRSHYLLSPVVGNVAVLGLMVWTSAQAKSIMWTPLFMLPYFVLYALDLRRLGYRQLDLFGVCALNLMLLPVNFAGIASSLRQLITGRKGSFSRTPKVADRTFIPPYAYLFNLGVMALMGYYAGRALLSGQYAGAIVPVVNIALYSYGLVRFVGVRDGFDDLLLSIATRFSAVGAIARGTGQRVAGSFARAGARLATASALAVVMVTAVPWSYGAGIADGEWIVPGIGSNGAVVYPHARAVGNGHDATIPWTHETFARTKPPVGLLADFSVEPGAQMSGMAGAMPPRATFPTTSGRSPTSVLSPWHDGVPPVSWAREGVTAGMKRIE